MAALVDTNVLVYRFDPRDPKKQRLANELLRVGLAADSLRVAHQAIIEFHSVVTRPQAGSTPFLEAADARRETEELLAQFPILYPNELVIRTALRGLAAYQFSWFDAHMWAYAEVFGLTDILTEDLQHDRMYGSVRAVNPFR